MEFELRPWLEEFIRRVTAAFPGRVVCIGLQGSRGRGEAGPDSDIDMAVVLDRLDMADVERYRQTVEALPRRELLCGFLSGRGELERWEPGDLFQFYYDTAPVLGDLEFLRGKFSPGDVERAVRKGVCDLYHGCVHNQIYERDGALLAGLYKGAVFTLQAKLWLETGEFVKKHRDLLERLAGEDRAVLTRALALKEGEMPDLEQDSGLLFHWAGESIRG